MTPTTTVADGTTDRTVGEGVAGADGLADLTDDRGFLGHPKGLAILFFAEMWERFSFYGMRSLLVLYLVQHFLFEPGKAQGLYAAYGSLVYLMPVVGGFIADRYLGHRRAVLIGAIFLTAGHGLMAFEGSGSQAFIETGGERYELMTEGRGENAQSFLSDGDELRAVRYVDGDMVLGGQGAAPSTIAKADFTQVVEQQEVYVQTLFLALSLIIVGVGFLKANISTMVGQLYGETDPRRDPGFTIFYVGINLGSLAAYIACGYLAYEFGWGYGFGAAGIGMLLGLVVFVLGKPLLRGRGEHRLTVKGVVTASAWIGGVIALAPIWFLVQRDEVVSTILYWAAPLLYLGLLAYAILVFKGSVRSRMIVAIVLTTFSVLFWALFEQAGSSLTLYAANNSTLPGFLNAAQVGFLNPGFIILLGPVFAWLWMTMAKKGIEPSTPVKFSLGLAQVGLGFIVLAWGASTFSTEVETVNGIKYVVPFVFLAAAYLLHSTGELCLSPVGLSMVTKLSAPSLVGLMMGAWFVSSALGHTVAGYIAKLTATETAGGVVTDSAGQLATYVDVFMRVGIVGLIIGVILLALSPFLKKGMAGIH